MKTIIVYGSMTGTTQSVAENLAELLNAKAMAAGDATEESLTGCEFLILGASTWGMGDLQDDMADFLPTLGSMNLMVSKGAIFGLGDQSSYADTFVDGMADMAQALSDKGITRIGDWPNAGFDGIESRALVGDTFCGLPLDEDNESEKTDERLSEWVLKIQTEIGA